MSPTLTPKLKRIIDKKQKEPTNKIHPKTGRSITNSEAKRLSALKKRQLTSWIKELNSILLKEGSKQSVEKIRKELYNKLRSDLLSYFSKNSQAPVNVLQIKFLEIKSEKILNNVFYSVLHSEIKPTELKKMNSQKVVSFLEEVSSKTERFVLKLLEGKIK